MNHHLTHTGLPPGLDRWALLRFLRTARRKLGLSKGAIGYLALAIERTMDGDFVTGRICAFWMSVTEIATSLDMERRQIARIEAELMARGLIHKSSTTRGRRCGTRLRGLIQHEFGINLAPLIERAREIKAMALAVEDEQKAAKALRPYINKLFQRIRDLGDEEAMIAADTILPSHRPSLIHDLARLQDVAAALEAVLNDYDGVGGHPTRQRRLQDSSSFFGSWTTGWEISRAFVPAG
ncbi:helix-turn-helix domain-containing protein [Thioclava sp. GXIMD4216]|uniref:helix-turn-helix domain-containing protein n=1 Tax=Thioclava sp. GXIMD4216 TaxID=3131929 RepID=UPI0030D627B8